MLGACVTTTLYPCIISLLIMLQFSCRHLSYSVIIISDLFVIAYIGNITVLYNVIPIKTSLYIDFSYYLLILEIRRNDKPYNNKTLSTLILIDFE